MRSLAVVLNAKLQQLAVVLNEVKEKRADAKEEA
jgi:hypothetical protein